jgi:molybdate/tungstate transport system permease protein
VTRFRPFGKTTPAFTILSALLVLFIVGPVVRLLVFSPQASIAGIVGDRELQHAIGLTILTATAATMVSVILGVPLAYLLARYRFPGRRAVWGVLQIPVLIPHPVAGIALLVFFGRNTALGRALATLGLEVVNHVPGLIAAMTFVSVPIFVSAATQAFRGVDPALERVARSLGDTEWAAFRRVTFPLARRAVAAGALISWARAVSEFGAIVVLTYHPRVASVLIYDRLTTDGLEGVIPAAALLVAVGVLVVIALSLLEGKEPT